MRTRLLAWLPLFLLAGVARGDDVWILEGIAETLLPQCEIVVWRPGAVAHNRDPRPVKH